MKSSIIAAALMLAASQAGAAALDLGALGYTKGDTLFSTGAATADNVFGSFAANGAEARGQLTLSGFDPYGATGFSFVLRAPDPVMNLSGTAPPSETLKAAGLNSFSISPKRWAAMGI